MPQSDPAQAKEHCDSHDRATTPLVRQTIPYPRAVKRTPLTSDRLSTTSTRLIDARRGLRPYSSVYYGHHGWRATPAYDDNFGITRPENRPYSYSRRSMGTSVQTFRNPHASRTSASVNAASPMVIRPAEHEHAQAPRAVKPTPVRVHQDQSARPSTSGAVMILSDGTVIQIGD